MSAPAKERHAFVCLCAKCDGVFAAGADVPHLAKTNGDMLVEALGSGARVQYWPSNAVRELGWCDCPRVRS